MIRIPLAIIALYFTTAGAFAQSDSSAYQQRKLKVEEVNFVTSYYHQEGNNAAVTGGVGSEKLTDVATTFDIRLSRTDLKNRVNNFIFEAGIDAYSSASSDKVDPSTVSSASASDQRFYPSASWSRVNEEKGTTIGANASVSSEYDYLSFGGGISLFKDSKDRMRQAGIRLQTFQDLVTMIYPIEQRDGKETGMKPRNTYASTFSLSQIVNKKLQMMFMLDLSFQDGFLSMPFNRVYFNDETVGLENLPDTRKKYPASIRMNYFVSDQFIIRSFYRYYQDDWKLKGNTAEIETVVKITPFISVSPFYRYYNQSAAEFFKPYQQHNAGEKFVTSDYDLSEFDSHFFGTGFRMVSPEGVFGISHLNMVELRYGHYNRQTGLTSNIISLNAKFK